MKKIILSVVIPVYNVEKYLAECVESVRGFPQTEIILVDDGSTDDSGKICDSYTDSNIFVIHQQNEGLSSARNIGLQYAQGKYVFFVDSDDYVVDMKAILEFLSWADCEILLFDGIGEDYYTHKGLRENVHYTGISCITTQLRKCGDYPTTVWLGIYRREYLLRNHLYFEKGLLHEDELWTQKVLIHAKDIGYLPRKLYFYRQREHSITDTAGKKNLSDLICIFGELFEYIPNPLIKANIAKRYLHAAAKYKAWKYPDLKPDKKSILIHAKGFTKMGALIFLFNTKFYCLLWEKLQ